MKFALEATAGTVPKQKPTIEELEAMLNSEIEPQIEIRPDGSLHAVADPAVVLAIQDAAEPLLAVVRACEDFDPKHQLDNLRSIAARCEDGVPSRDLLHDIWKIMSALKDSRLTEHLPAALAAMEAQ